MQADSTPSGQLGPTLTRVRWRLRLRDGVDLAQRTLWAALGGSLAVIGVTRIFPIDEQAWKGALIPLGLWLAWLVVHGLRRQPDMTVALRADAELHLKERLSTSLALERAQGSAVYAAFVPELVGKAHADALHAAQGIDPARDFPLRLRRRAMAVAAGLLIATVLLAALPNPMDAVIAQRKAVAAEAKRQAQQVEQLQKQVENAKEMTPEERADLLRKLAELARQLRANPGNREQALADLAKLQEELRQKVDPQAGQRQAALSAMAAQMQAMAKNPNPQVGDLQAAAEAMKQLAEQMKDRSPAERQAAAQQLAQMAARAAQAGDGALAQALSAMAQAAQNGDQTATSQAASQAATALQQAQSSLANQRAFSQALSQLQQSQQSLAQAGQQSGQQAQQGPGAGQSPGQGQQNGQGPGQGQNSGQGTGRGNQAGGGGGTNASSLPPATRTGKAGKPTGAGTNTGTSPLSSQVYVPREKQGSAGGQVFVPGQDTNQGQTQSKESRDPLGGVTNPALVPYTGVYQNYLDAANQAMQQSYIPPGLQDYIKQYFSQLEP